MTDTLTAAEFAACLADELMVGCPEDDPEMFSDHLAIADAIRRGDPVDTILGMSEIDRWPDTYVWVKHRLGGAQ